MAEIRPLPTNYWSQRKSRAMSPSARHVGVFLWTNKNTTSCGVYQIDPAEIAFSTGYDESTCRLHLKDLIENNHIRWDEETLEVFILDWFRYHRFKGAGKTILCRDLERIESKTLKQMAIQAAIDNQVLDRNEGNQGVDLPTTTPTTTKPNLEPQQQPQPKNSEQSYPQDKQPLCYPKGLTELEKKLIEQEISSYGVDDVQKALDELSPRLNSKDHSNFVNNPVAWVRALLKGGVQPTREGIKARSLRMGVANA